MTEHENPFSEEFSDVIPGLESDKYERQSDSVNDIFYQVIKNGNNVDRFFRSVNATMYQIIKACEADKNNLETMDIFRNSVATQLLKSDTLLELVVSGESKDPQSDNG